MLWASALILLILWAVGYLGFHLAGSLIHLLLVSALIVVSLHLFQERRTL